jgi:hypothetical protein
MAVAIVLDFDGGTLEQYDQVIDRMGLVPGGEGPPGAIFHWVTATDGGIRVTDVWETREQFDQFAQSQIQPITREAGMGPPRMAVHEVHNHLGAAVGASTAS